MSAKLKTSLALSEGAVEYLKRLAEGFGLTRSAVVEMLIRREAKRSLDSVSKARNKSE